MKSKLHCLTLSLLALLVFSKSFAQTKEPDKDIVLYRKLIIDATLQECDDEGNVSNFTKKTIKAGAKFSIYKQTEDAYIIMFWKWVPEEEFDNLISDKSKRPKQMFYNQNVTLKPIDKAENFNFYYNNNDALVRRYFLLPKKDVPFQAEELRARLQPVAGTAVLPFKFRPQQSDWGKDISLSSLVGFKHYWTKDFSTGMVTGIGIASVNVDSASTRGVTKKATDLAAISFPVGLVFEYKGIQAGIFSGWDWISKNNDYNWRFQGKNWFAIGLGISVFSDGLAKKTSSDSQ